MSNLLPLIRKGFEIYLEMKGDCIMYIIECVSNNADISPKTSPNRIGTQELVLVLVVSKYFSTFMHYFGFFF